MLAFFSRSKQNPNLYISSVDSQSTMFLITLSKNVYILGVFTEKLYSKPLKRNVVYIPIITLSHATSHDFNDVKINHGSLQSDWTSARSLHH